MVAVPLVEYAIAQTEVPPFVFSAFFIGTIGGAMGVLHSLDFSTVESQLLFENMQLMQKASDENKGEEIFSVGEIGTLNKMVQYAKHMFVYDNVDETEITGHRLGAHLADTPCTVKGRKDTVWPKREMLALFS